MLLFREEKVQGDLSVQSDINKSMTNKIVLTHIQQCSHSTTQFIVLLFCIF